MVPQLKNIFFSVGCLILFMQSFDTAQAKQQYKCSVCSTNGKSCKQASKDMKSGCDYCLQITGNITGTVPDLIKEYAKSKPEYKNLSLNKGKTIFVRDCLTEKQIRALGFTPRVDCSKFKNDNGFTGDACTCPGDC